MIWSTAATFPFKQVSTSPISPQANGDVLMRKMIQMSGGSENSWTKRSESSLELDVVFCSAH